MNMSDDMRTEKANSCFLFPFGKGQISQKAVPDLMGIKGANLLTMDQLGLPVPAGFVMSVEIGREVAQGQRSDIKFIADDIRKAIDGIESAQDKIFGGEQNPLLVSVRSGAAVSMPGMMDTVLNLGLNDATVKALAETTGDARFAWDTYRRFVQSFSQVVLGLDGYDFEDVLDEARLDKNVDTDAELDAACLQHITQTFQNLVQSETGEPFPQDVFKQLDLALMAVFNSWNTKRAQRYRDMNKIPHEGGTAAIVQAMVFGNRDQRSCTGVYFTRNPSTGEKLPYGEYMINAQGEDVVSGIRTPMELTEADRIRAVSDNPSMEKLLPAAFDALLQTGEKLEQYFQDMQEIEFTVESERLFMLQTRVGKRTPKAALRMAVSMADEQLISQKEAVMRCDLKSLSAMLVSKVQPKEDVPMLCKGLAASPGAAVGEIVFTSQDAVDVKQQGRACILVRSETDPKDVHGMDAAVGILTSRGGMTSHAAVVARGMGKPCITAAMSVKIDVANQTCMIQDKSLSRGDVITLDGGTGAVYEGVHPIVMPEPDGELAILLSWKEEAKQK